MIGIWFLAFAAAQSLEQQPITADIQVRASITPAIGPYLLCLVRAQEQMQWGDPPRAARLRRFVEGSRQQCAQARAAARTQALGLIESDAGVPPAERQAVVDAALGSVDASDEAFLQEVERRERGSSSPESDRDF